MASRNLSWQRTMINATTSMNAPPSACGASSRSTRRRPARPRQRATRRTTAAAALPPAAEGRATAPFHRTSGAGGWRRAGRPLAEVPAAQNPPGAQNHHAQAADLGGFSSVFCRFLPFSCMARLSGECEPGTTRIQSGGAPNPSPFRALTRGGCCGCAGPPGAGVIPPGCAKDAGEQPPPSRRRRRRRRRRHTATQPH